MCELCGFPDYKHYKTDLTFKTVRQSLSIEQRNKYEKGIYMFVTRHTVLGRMKELKNKIYNEEKKLHEQVCGG